MKIYLLLIILLLSNINIKAQNISLINQVCKGIDLDINKVKINLSATKINPADSSETIVVIPEISKESDDYYELNSWVLIVKTTSGKIKYKYYESSKTNGWVSDALKLRSISIDTAPYFVADNKRAFGVRLFFEGSSNIYPFHSESISLFLRENENIRKVLKNFTCFQYNGEREGECIIESLELKKILIMTNDVINGFCNIKIREKITKIESRPNKNGDCITEKSTTQKTENLKYRDEFYHLE